MKRQRTNKLNQLQRLLPEGLVVDAAWLEAKGYSRALRSRYVAHGWLTALARGVYWRPPHKPGKPAEAEQVRWRNVVVSLQTLLLETGEWPVVVGGRTALELHGFAHYLASSGPREIHLYGDGKPPGWLFKLELDCRFLYHNAKRLFREDPMARGLDSQTWGHWPLTLSTPERAVLELLDELPKRESFHQADMLIAGLRNLGPRRLHKLLVDCRSVKVKRLFLWFAERHGHPWLKRLDRSGIGLGRGKRMLVRGGRLDSKYRITVPENLDAGG